jgi:hypothetical protein
VYLTLLCDFSLFLAMAIWMLSAPISEPVSAVFIPWASNQDRDVKGNLQVGLRKFGLDSLGITPSVSKQDASDFQRVFRAALACGASRAGEGEDILI